ncbi:WD40-repeat-containing domain protein [Rhizoctonia solani]|nr:WD40-repeat-containing domain protein [Rhizoctonia solani]
MRVILEILLKFGPELPLKYFITSRPEPAISNLMISSENYSPSILYLHDIEQSIVEEDIRKYLKEAFQAMHPHPSEDQINCLAKRAGKLFIYAATVVRYILPDRMAVDPNARLTAMLAADPHSRKVQGPSKMYRELDALYTTILSTAFDRDIMEQRELEDMELMMRSIICSKEPVTCQTLSGLFGLTEQRVLSALRPLRSVLHISEDAGIISTLHASFPEYVLDQHRAGEFYCSEEQQDQVLTSYAFDSDLVDLKERFSKYVSPALVYSCRYWSEHLQPTEASNVLSGMLAEFLSSRLLFWIEVLNLGKYIRTAPSILNIARRWSKAYGNMAEITQQLTDAWNFVNRFTASTCSLSTPHIYVSALPFCPKSSSVYRNYWPLMKGILDIKGTALKERPQPTLGTLKLDSSALSVAFSYDGTRIASGFDDGTIRVWDTHTRAIVLAPFEAHIRSVLSVVFSPDDTLIVSCSDDCNIQVWDAYKGTLVAGPFDSHTRPVVSVSFSSDNTHIASGSLDCTIRIWNARTGVAVFGPFHNATPITAVEFSPDGSSIAAGSDDCAIRIWDVRTGTAIIGPLRGHAGPIRCIVFSRDGVYAVTGSDDHSIQVWDAHTDNGYIVSGSHDCTIRIWDMAASAASSTLFGVHDRSVMAVAFSPDGALIVSGSSDRTIRVWDASVRGSPPNSPQKTKITSLAISPNGNYICSGSSDLAIRVWCAQTGSLVYGPWSGHTSRIQAVAFSLDCGRTVSGDTQGFIKIWDLNTSLGAIVSFQTYTDPIRAIAFSPEGDQIVSDFGSKGIWLWDAVTGVPCRSSLIMEAI